MGVLFLTLLLRNSAGDWPGHGPARTELGRSRSADGQDHSSQQHRLDFPGQSRIFVLWICPFGPARRPMDGTGPAGSSVCSPEISQASFDSVPSPW